MTSPQFTLYCSLQYGRDFSEDENGGRVIDLFGEDSERQIEDIFGSENTSKCTKTGFEIPVQLLTTFTFQNWVEGIDPS